MAQPEFQPVLATGGHKDCSDFAEVKVWLLHLGCSVTITVFVKRPQVPGTETVFVSQSSAAHSSAAEQSSPSSAYLCVLFCVKKRYPNTINALLSILGINHERT